MTKYDNQNSYTNYGDYMKEYYVFDIKKDFIKLYENKASDLFYIFNRIYYMKEIDKMYGYNLFEQISNFFDKNKINEYLYDKYKDKIMYSYSGNEHVINNLFLNEISILKVKSSNIRIETNSCECTFLQDLKEYNKNFFVCNFKEQEYFFIKNIKIENKTI